MPYVTPERRRLLDCGADVPTNAGELNYLFTQLAEAYRALNGDSYSTFNDIVGAFDNAKDEFRRRVQHPYEDRKRAENGDVYAPLEDRSHGNI